MAKTLNNEYLGRMAGSVGYEGPRLLNNDYLKIIAEGIGNMQPGGGSAYKDGGSVTASDLTASLLKEENVGTIYNVSDGLAITASNVGLFVDVSDGDRFPRGTNVRVVKVDSAYRFDVMQGIFEPATPLTDGLMSAADKAKLDGIANNANNYELPLMSASTRGGAKLGRGLAVEDGALSVQLDAESDGTDAGPIVELTARGWATQDGTTGKNLFDKEAYPIVNDYRISTSTGYAVADDEGFSAVVEYVPCEHIAGSTVTLNHRPKGSNPGFGFYDLSKTFLSGIANNGGAEGNPWTITIPQDAKYMRLTVQYNEPNIQLELGSTATSYEPYTGGAPSPSPDYPQEIQVVRGHEVTGKTGRYVDLVVKQGNTTLSTTPIPLPSRGWVGALPDGTADTLMLDGAGKVVWERVTDEVVLDGSSDEVWNDWRPAQMYYKYTSAISSSLKKGVAAYGLCDSYVYTFDYLHADAPYFHFNGSDKADSNGNLSFYVGESVSDNDWRARLSAHPVTVLYPATPVTEEMGYVDLPSIPEGATITIPELDALGVHYLTDDAAAEMARQWYERARAEYAVRIEDLETTVAYLMSRTS